MNVLYRTNLIEYICRNEFKTLTSNVNFYFDHVNPESYKLMGQTKY